MSHLEFEPWEPEESVGKLWHALVGNLDAPEQFAAAAVTLDQMRGRLGVLFRGLGGGYDVELKPAARTQSAHRLSWKRALGQGVEQAERPSYDGEVLRLPSVIATFSEPEANAALYLWLAAFAVHGAIPQTDLDALDWPTIP